MTALNGANNNAETKGFSSENPHAIVSVKQLGEFFNLVNAGCGECSSRFEDIAFTPKSAVVCAILRCEANHVTKWYSCDSIYVGMLVVGSAYIVLTC